MIKKKTLLFVIILAFLVAFLSCPPEVHSTNNGGQKDDVNKVGERKVAHRSIISLEKEIAIGKQYASEIDRSAKLLTDPVVNEYVNRMAQNLARNSDLQVPLTVKVIDSPEINAFALPGGFLYINTGLLLAADGESQMAGVIAHEIAHIAARHWASQMTKATLLRYATIPLIFIPMTYPVYILTIEGMNIGIPMAFLKFSRNDEAEADMLGLQYMYKAGYDPSAYITFFSKIIEEDRKNPGKVPTIFASHPPTPERILKSEERIRATLPKREQYLISTSEFDDVKERLRVVMTTSKKTGKEGPTLRRREGGEEGSPEKPKEKEEKPPVLQRRD